MWRGFKNPVLKWSPENRKDLSDRTLQYPPIIGKKTSLSEHPKSYKAYTWFYGEGKPLLKMLAPGRLRPLPSPQTAMLSMMAASIADATGLAPRCGAEERKAEDFGI